MTAKLTPAQTRAIETIRAAGGTVPAKAVHSRTAGALERRALVRRDGDTLSLVEAAPAAPEATQAALSGLARAGVPFAGSLEEAIAAMAAAMPAFEPEPAPEPDDESDLSEARRESLRLARALGASQEALQTIREATRVYRSESIVLPFQHLETLSRGKGWCRHGQGDDAIWGERVVHGYRVSEPGTWTVCGKDGFTRERRETWEVERVQVGSQTWTIAN